MDIDTIVRPVEENLAQFEKNFTKLLHSNVPMAEQVVQYIAGRRGKRLRPLTVFLAARLHGDINDQTMKMCYVVELLHTATLVHDDVVDNSNERRGSPTVNHLWDNKISVLVGDFLFSKTLTTLLEIKNHTALDIFSQTTKLITEGELLQIERAEDWRIDEDTYFDLILKKTASLFSASCRLGALSVGSDQQLQERINKVGEYFGMAFQIRDDILDYTGDEKVLGKPVGNDIRENKVTLPLIYALKNASPEKNAAMVQLLEKKHINKNDIHSLVSFVKEEGGVDYSMRLVHSYVKKALTLLDDYSPSLPKQSFIDLIEFTLDRQK